MKRTFKDASMAIIVGLGLSAIGVLLWIYPMPTMFLFGQVGQNTLAGICILAGVLTMIFGDPK